MRRRPSFTGLGLALKRTGMLIPLGEDGLYARSGGFEDILDGIDRMISVHGESRSAERLRLPPIMRFQQLAHGGYPNAFPHLVGRISNPLEDPCDHATSNDSVDGSAATHQHGAGSLALVPAACYPLYGIIAERGPLPRGGRLIDVMAYCFRREPSRDPARMQSFRMREYVRFGSQRQVMDFRKSWIDRGLSIAAHLALPATIALANDPFAGRGSALMTQSQRENQMKYELTTAIANEGSPTACMSFNYHGNHFATRWDIRSSDQSIAHTGCVGFGMERLALALIARHGCKPMRWPRTVRRCLGL